MEQTTQTTLNIPALALRGLTIFPKMLMSIDVEREMSIRALERAVENDEEIFLVAQREIGPISLRRRISTPWGRCPWCARCCGFQRTPFGC